jgi:membrane-associated phospholipid phosphatase
LAGIQVRGILEPAQVVAIFALVAWLRPSFRYCFGSFAVYVAFSTAFIVLIYALGTSHWPLADPGLTWFDRLMGVGAHQVALATEARPLLAKAMYLIYFSAIPQTIFLIVWMGFRHDARLSLFLYRYMICGLITVACFYFVPALGAAGIDTTTWNAGAARDLLALRRGDLTAIDCTSACGIVTFPSFHAIWAILLICALPTWPMIVLNVLMLASTVTSGGHYFIDLIGGALVCAVIVPMTARQFAGRTSAAPVANPVLQGLASE